MVGAWRRKLGEWYDRAQRPLPWRETRDPYRILVSEVMLQQTRVAAVIPYYQRFLTRFPTAEALAAAPEPELLTAWAGLGYYSRARNLQRAAREIAGAGFPAGYAGIRALPGVGDYTAAAVASIAFGLPHAVVDGNVRRVLIRVTGDADVGVQGTADTLLDPADPARYNQALMELGATVCLPRDPQCLVCPVAELCEARRTGRQQELPPKRRRREAIRLNHTLYVVRRNGAVLLRQRPATERLMAGFWDVPRAEELTRAAAGACLGEFRHAITHHLYRFEVREAHLRGRTPADYRWHDERALDALPLTTVARKALRITFTSL